MARFAACNRRLLLLVALVATLAAQPAWAARLLDVHIDRDGAPAVRTNYSDNGRAGPAGMWRYLGKAPIMVDADLTKLVPDADDPLRVTLEGDIVLKFSHGNDSIVEARMSRLTLRRDDNQTQAWYLPEAEVERTASLAGLGPPMASAPVGIPKRGILLSIVGLIVGLFVILVVAVLLAVVLFSSSRKRAPLDSKP